MEQAPAAPRPNPLSAVFRAPATLVILAACGALFAVAESHGDTTTTETLVRYGASERELVRDGGYWRLVSAMFLHIGAFHLVWNLAMMFGLCAAVERTLGSWRFLAAYFLSGIAASAVSVVGHDVVAAGASGAGFGMVGVSFVLARLRLGSWSAFWDDAESRRNAKSTAIWLAIGFMGLPMDNHAHLGGLAAGLALGGLLAKRPASKGGWAFFSAAWVAVVAAALAPWGDSGHRLARDGYEACLRGDYKGSIEAFDRAERAGYRGAELYCNRGLARMSLKDPAAAVGDFTKGIAADPKPFGPYRLRASAYIELKNWERAMNDVQSALLIEPKFPDAYYDRGRIRIATGFRREAVADFSEALRLAPSNWWARSQAEAELAEAKEGG